MPALTADPYRGEEPLADFVRRISEEPVPCPDDEDRLLAAARAGDAGAFDALVRCRLRLAVDEALRFRGGGQRTEDLIDPAIRALVEALRSYDPAGGEDLGSWARRRVRAELNRRFAD